MTYFKNQFSTLLIYILLLFTGSVLTLLKVTGSSYFIILTIAAIVATILMVYLTQKSSPNIIEKKTETSDKLKWIIIGTLGALAIQIVISLLEMALNKNVSSANTTQLLTLVSAYPYYFIYVLICAPIMEEIVFRRLFFSNLISLTNVYGAAIISAAFFAFMHQDTRFIIYVGMGLWFAFIYYKSKNIYVSAASHLIMNTIVVIASFFS
ncbi:CPBP family intramembrane glutamic endopeptidase [Companilactobacillus baiquanensis]|uniref:CPBP family intramembrane glutamic endopeptidase n=1 Tax=Companilactobacillus baiquanensis TaxID=2486005 RepID=A0ABW1UV79_9LACO|nr:type II CAAX endopeptidase family protein [Companilactobacillus baiquanensis]